MMYKLYDSPIFFDWPQLGGVCRIKALGYEVDLISLIPFHPTPDLSIGITPIQAKKKPWLTSKTEGDVLEDVPLRTLGQSWLKS